MHHPTPCSGSVGWWYEASPMRTALALTLALSTAGCGFAVKHPAAMAAIVGGTMGGLTCEIGTDFDEHAACGITTLGAAALLGGVVLLATALGGEGNTVLRTDPELEGQGEEPPSIDDGPSGELPPGVEPVPTTPAPEPTPAPTTPAPTTP